MLKFPQNKIGVTFRRRAKDGSICVMNFDELLVFEYNGFPKADVDLPFDVHLAGRWFYRDAAVKEGLDLLNFLLRREWLPIAFPKALEASISKGRITKGKYMQVRNQLSEDPDSLAWVEAAT